EGSPQSNTIKFSRIPRRIEPFQFLRRETFLRALQRFHVLSGKLAVLFQFPSASTLEVGDHLLHEIFSGTPAHQRCKTLPGWGKIRSRIRDIDEGKVPEAREQARVILEMVGKASQTGLPRIDIGERDHRRTKPSRAVEEKRE